MRVWTTPQLNEQLRIAELPLRQEPAGRIRDLYLSQSEPGDAVILGLDNDYQSFLAAAAEQGIRGPILLIAEEPSIIAGDLHRYNALALDIKRTGEAEARNIVNVVLKLAAERALPPGPDVCTDEGETRTDETITDILAVHERLEHVRKKALPVIVAFETLQEGEPVTARGNCAIREIRNDAVVLHAFRQNVLLRGIKKDMRVTLYFTYKQKNHGSVVVVRELSDTGLSVSVPTRLFITREMRIQPRPSNPVDLYVNIPNEPTTRLTAADISTRGIGFVCGRDLPVNGEYGMTIMLPDPRAIVVATGTIRFRKECGRGIRYGAELRTHPWDEENLAKYVMKREAEIVNMLRNG